MEFRFVGGTSLCFSLDGAERVLVLVGQGQLVE